MDHRHMQRWSRREFLAGVTLAGTMGLRSTHSKPLAAEPPPETTTIRLYKMAGICVAPQYVAEELLRLEGFTDVQYLRLDSG